MNFKSFIIAVFICILSAYTLALSQVKGGGPTKSGPEEPYGTGDISIDSLRRVRNDASRSKTMRDTIFQTISRYREVGFAFTKNQRITGRPFYQLRGKKENEWIGIDLSDIESISFLQQARGQVLLKVTMFPYISPDELLRMQPDYSSLRSRYTKEVSLWVLLDNNREGELALIGKSSSDAVNIIAKLRDIKLNTVLTLEYGRGQSYFRSRPIWWAIPSVVQDPAYPFRRRLPQTRR